MAETVKQLTQVWKRLTVGQRVALISSVVLTAALMIGVFVYASQPEYGVLFSDMRQADAGSVVEKLKAAGVPYKLSDGGASVSVPVEKIPELRLQIASSGALSGGHVGFDIFDKNNFGATDFVQQVNYQRALEGELARTLEGMNEVRTARVHITRSRESLFADKTEPAKASVALTLRNRSLSEERAQAIVTLIASAVEGLDPEHVTVMDTAGRLIAGGRNKSSEIKGGVDAVDSVLAVRHKLEAETAARVVALLEPITGPGHVRADVSVDMNFDQVEQTEENFDPQSSAIRTQQTSQEIKNAPIGAGGVAGTRANDPALPPAVVQNVSGAAADQKSSATTAYEIDKIVKRTVYGGGRITRLSLSVLLDTNAANGARSPEDLKKIQDLAAAAVGLDNSRGDQVVVQMIPFSQPANEAQNLNWFERNREIVKMALRYGAPVLVALLLILFVLRPVSRAVKLTASPARAAGPLFAHGQDHGNGHNDGNNHARAADALAALPSGDRQSDEAEDNKEHSNSLRQSPPPRTVAELEAEVAKELIDPTAVMKEARANVLKKKAAQFGKEEPAKVAMTIRSWLREK